MTSEEKVRMIYKYLLDRQPENEQIVKELATRDFDALIELTITSAEFFDRNKMLFVQRFL